MRIPRKLKKKNRQKMKQWFNQRIIDLFIDLENDPEIKRFEELRHKLIGINPDLLNNKEESGRALVMRQQRLFCR
jgi:indole-3-glycerol phosphate synthase